MKPILQLRFREVKQSAQKIKLLEDILFLEELKKKKKNLEEEKLPDFVRPSSDSRTMPDYLPLQF